MTCKAIRERDGAWRCLPCHLQWDDDDDKPPCIIQDGTRIVETDFGRMIIPDNFHGDINALAAERFKRGDNLLTLPRATTRLARARRRAAARRGY